MIRAILESSTEASMAEAGRIIASTSCFKDLSLHYFQEYNPEKFVKLALLLQKYGNNYKVQGERQNSTGSDLSFYHDFGRKWSEFIATLLHNELIRLGLDHTFENSDNAVVFRFAESIQPENQDSD